MKANLVLFFLVMSPQQELEQEELPLKKAVPEPNPDEGPPQQPPLEPGMALTPDMDQADDDHAEDDEADGEEVLEDFDQAAFQALDRQLDALDRALDTIEERNDDLHHQMKDLLGSNGHSRRQDPPNGSSSAT
ncbi:hypothetical protein TCAL_14687 [Tigriopus californicus]|uniref:Uncharacterized protein n=1 Tax=Tigriopus californicus TaxID=6832 RepID=A0A553NQB6_TIGCA|nr:UPF0184 protein AAEL002161-like [Tigriopus californicus]TRY67628.1 hypothetical protein TCAL_14687 [Tigriopus californicus]